MSGEQKVFLPERYAFQTKIAGQRVCQVAVPARTLNVEATPFQHGKAKGWIVQDGEQKVLLTAKVTALSEFHARLLVPGMTSPPSSSEQLSRNYRWLEPKPSQDLQEILQSRQRVLESWGNNFSFRQEVVKDGELVNPGLRSPQLGAIHAALAHWTIHKETGTIVLPTGTGKTDTMVALLVCHRIDRLLVVVPSDALREQLSQKFMGLGILAQASCITDDVLKPVVGVQKGGLKTQEEVENFFGACNVIVSTVSSIASSSIEAKAAMVALCGCLFIDEAHHAAAETWNALKERFEHAGKPVLQFTATPFRRDGKFLGGRNLYTYPLRKAQEEGYFTPIDFVSIWEYAPHRGDVSIAVRALETLRKDIADGRDHLMMARTASIARAADVKDIYQALAPDLQPEIVHSDLPQSEKDRVLQKLRGQQARIVVCVDMLGEGFDLPQLKVAALHDVHKSLAVTLQFIGRFTRVAKNLGRATVVANAALANVDTALQDLYAKDSDWNHLLKHLSEGMNLYQQRRSEFLLGFNKETVGVPLHVLRPKLSTVVYKTKCRKWRPSIPFGFFKKTEFLMVPNVNEKENVLVYITRVEEPVRWGDTKAVSNVEFHLYLAHWNADQGLLYINSTDTSSLHVDLAQALAGEEVELIRGERVYRSFHDVKRLILTNLGLTHQMSKSNQFSMHVGSDIAQGLSTAALVNRRKSNIFSRGYRNGEPVTLGASYKGRVWSMQAAGDLSEWVSWSHDVGKRLADDTISTSQILDHAMVPTPVVERPPFAALTIDWNEYFYARTEENLNVEVAGQQLPFWEVEMRISDFGTSGNIKFEVVAGDQAAEYEVRFHAGGVAYSPTKAGQVYVTASKKREELGSLFVKHPPSITFEDCSVLVYNELCVPTDSVKAYDRTKFEVWDWTGCDITKESQYKKPAGTQTLQFRPDSVQRRVLEVLEASAHNYDVIFDDDGTGEVADVVALKATEEAFVVHLYHCKYAGGESSGTRVKDVYEVCGQAQKCAHWRTMVDRLFTRLPHREQGRMASNNTTRFHVGDLAKLEELKRRHRSPLKPQVHIWIVQPGLSASNVSDDQLMVLGATELFLRETFSLPLTVVASP